MSTLQETIEQTVESWPGVEKLPHRFGGVEFRVKGHEIGHLHGSRQADLPFTIREREELVANGRASVHHVLPRTGWVTYYLHGPDSVGSPLPVCTGLIGLTSLGWRGRSPLSLSHQLLISIEIWKRKLDHI